MKNTTIAAILATTALFGTAACSDITAAPTPTVTTTVTAPPETPDMYPSTQAAPVNQTWASWSDDNMASIEGASQSLEHGSAHIAAADTDLTDAGDLLLSVTLSPDGGTVSDHLHAAGRKFLAAADLVTAGDYASGARLIRAANAEVNEATAAVNAAREAIGG